MKKIKSALALLIVFLLLFSSLSQTVFAATYIRKGSRGDEVKRVQQRLYDLGYPVGTIDGIAGNGTINALVLFQKNNDLEADGIAGPKTLEIMFSGVAGETQDTNEQAESRTNVIDNSGQSDSPTSIMATLRVGSKGHPVTLLQSRLNELGYSTGYPDGTFGPKTFNAVMTFQRVNNLYVDGVVGPSTIAKLFGNAAVGKPEGQSNISSTATGEAIVAFAKQYLGTPYTYGGNGPKSFDCSGFTCFVFKNFNVSLPRVAANQRSVGYEVAKADLIPGDLILFTSPSSGSSIGHVGIYIGNGEFIHASSGSTMSVTISSLNSATYTKRFVTARRVIS